jgi:hypothetical protein
MLGDVLFALEVARAKLRGERRLLALTMSPDTG